MKLLRAVLLVAFATTIGAVGFLYSGLYPMGADTPHTGPVYWALETLRERSIARAIRDIEAPDLSDPQLLLAGGPDYNDMCAGCHLKPGRSASDLSQGLYPQPPNLAEASDDHSHAHDPAISAARQFWIIKHGIKASGMAAFGPTHDDERIWALVAFLQKLPELTPAQYQILTARDAADSGASRQSHSDTGHGEAPKPNLDPTDQSAVKALDAFTHALRSGDAESALTLLSPQVLIYEGGGAERSRDEYLNHHLKADMAFLSQARIDIRNRVVQKVGTAVVVLTESRIEASSQDQPVSLLNTETAVLEFGAEGWQITHLHWSSRDHASTQ